MALTLADVLRHFGPQYLREHELSAPQARAWRDILSCRSGALGGQRLQCDSCGHTRWQHNSCRNRACPQCQTRQREAWRAARLAELLELPYCHLVFTLPHELNALAAAHPRWLYETVLRCVAATLSEFAANPRWLGATGAFTLVLHTWTQDLRRHVHVHALMACGGLRRLDPRSVAEEGGAAATTTTDDISTDADADADADARHVWVKPTQGERFLFPVKALSPVFKGKFLAALAQSCTTGALPRDPADSPEHRRQRAQVLQRHAWVVYAKTPLAGPASVLDYLSRYTYRTAIGNERLVAISGHNVLLRVRDNQHKRKGRVVAIDGVQFIARFLQHLLPGGFKRIRHYGLLAPALKSSRLAIARTLLGMPQQRPQVLEDAQAFMRRVAALQIERCTHCQDGRWSVIETRPRDSAALAQLWPRIAHACRGPPRAGP
jgi:hypothetical protein